MIMSFTTLAHYLTLYESSTTVQQYSGLGHPENTELFAFQEPIGCTNEVHPLNMSLMSTTTDEMSHMCNGWLNNLQLQNIRYIVLTDDVFQPDNDWLNEVHPANIQLISITDEVSQLDNDWLNELHPYSMFPI